MLFFTSHKSFLTREVEDEIQLNCFIKITALCGRIICASVRELTDEYDSAELAKESTADQFDIINSAVKMGYKQFLLNLFHPSKYS